MDGRGKGSYLYLCAMADGTKCQRPDEIPTIWHVLACAVTAGVCHADYSIGLPMVFDEASLYQSLTSALVQHLHVSGADVWSRQLAGYRNMAGRDQMVHRREKYSQVSCISIYEAKG